MLVHAAIVCEDFSPDGIFSDSKCAVLKTATLAASESCSEEIYALNNECQYGGRRSNTCECFARSKLFTCQDFFDIKRLKHFDCNMLEIHFQENLGGKKPTEIIKKLCSTEVKLIQAAQDICAQKHSNDRSLPVCKILLNTTSANQLSCDDVAAYVPLARTPAAKKNCFSKSSAIRSAQVMCAAKFRTKITTQGAPGCFNRFLDS